MENSTNITKCFGLSDRSLSYLGRSWVLGHLLRQGSLKLVDFVGLSPSEELGELLGDFRAPWPAPGRRLLAAIEHDAPPPSRPERLQTQTLAGVDGKSCGGGPSNCTTAKLCPRWPLSVTNTRAYNYMLKFLFQNGFPSKCPRRIIPSYDC